MDKAGKAHSGTYVSYIRVSTTRQGKSGLGLEAQREAIKQHLNGGNWQLAGEFIEVESGRMVRRPQLTAALQACKQLKATLIVAKLDRLYRNVHAMTTLMQAGVNFVCVDNPHMDKFTTHLMAAFAERERDLISERTTAALKAAKRRGVVLGNPNPQAAAAKGRKVLSKQADAYAENVMPIVREIVRSGNTTYQKIADALMRRGVLTPRGHETWRPAQVANLLNRKVG